MGPQPVPHLPGRPPRTSTAAAGGSPQLAADVPCLLFGTRLDLLQSFLVLSEELHVGRAAARLFVTQSGLSRRLAALECQLGASLFERTTRCVVLSEAGAVLLPYARALLEQAAEASHQLRLVTHRTGRLPEQRRLARPERVAV